MSKMTCATLKRLESVTTCKDPSSTRRGLSDGQDTVSVRAGCLHVSRSAAAVCCNPRRRVVQEQDLKPERAVVRSSLTVG